MFTSLELTNGSYPRSFIFFLFHPAIYRTDPTRLPVYQTMIANQPSNQSCSNYVCQYATEEKLALQLTTPNAPPNPAALIGIDSYIGGNSGNKPAWVPVSGRSGCFNDIHDFIGWHS